MAEACVVLAPWAKSRTASVMWLMIATLGNG